MMRIREIITALESLAPPALQESYDNCGLLCGSAEEELAGITVALDVTEEVILEAKAAGSNLIVAHHPLIFRGLKRLTGSGYTEKAVIAAIRHNMAVYAIHTNLDNVLHGGVNGRLAEMLGLTDVEVLSPLNGKLRKLITFVPEQDADAVREALFAAGAGHIGRYDLCSFNTAGLGTFRGAENTNPAIGEPGELVKQPEIRIETVFPWYLSSKILKALFAAHPYEEVAYDVLPLENAWQDAGAGAVGNLPHPVKAEGFPAWLKEKTGASVVKFTGCGSENIERIALCGGSGSFLIGAAMASGAQAFVTSDIKYHEFFDGESRMMICDIGHYESERHVMQLLSDYLTEKFPTFAVRLTWVNTNPVKYLS